MWFVQVLVTLTLQMYLYNSTTVVKCSLCGPLTPIAAKTMAKLSLWSSITPFLNFTKPACRQIWAAIWYRTQTQSHKVSILLIEYNAWKREQFIIVDNNITTVNINLHHCEADLLQKILGSFGHEQCWKKIVKTNNHISTVFDEIFVTQVTAFVACEHKLWTSGCYDEMFISTTIRDPQTFHRAGKSKFYCLNELPNKENPDHQQMCFRNLEKLCL